MPDPTLALAQQIIALPSVTPEDGGCCDLFAGRLQALGFSIEFINRNGVTNLWARRGHAAPLFVFAGHTDVVPTGPLDQWTSPPFAPEIRDGMLYGRGAADMKSSQDGDVGGGVAPGERRADGGPVGECDRDPLLSLDGVVRRDDDPRAPDDAGRRNAPAGVDRDEGVGRLGDGSGEVVRERLEHGGGRGSGC